MRLHFNIDREEDGRYIAEVPELPGVLTYGRTAREARSAALALAFRVLAEGLEAGELRVYASKCGRVELPFLWAQRPSRRGRRACLERARRGH